MLAAAALAVARPADAQEQRLGLGERLYREKCAQCHGAEGRGDGPAADRLNPRPRDFTRGQFKIRSTESRELPTDEDLYRIISQGMPGTAMPGWDHLSQEERRALVAQVKGFAPQFERLDRAPKEIRLDDRVDYSEDSAAAGRRVYEELECVKCHGRQGRGDGPSALSLVDEWGDPIRPADLTQPWRFRGERSAPDLYRRFLSGLTGSPMPSIRESFVLDEEIEEIQIKIEDEEPLTAQQERKYAEAMRQIRVKTWHLANYVRSLGPQQEPVARTVLTARRVEGPLPAGWDDSIWEEAEESAYPLAGQVIVEPRNFTPAIEMIFAKSVHNGDEIALLLTWDDPSPSRPPPASEAGGPAPPDTAAVVELPDAVAVQFPAALADGPERPYFLMGDRRREAYAWRWRASPSGDPGPEGEPAGRALEVNARGFEAVVEQPAERQDLSWAAAYEDGRYRLLLRRSLSTEDGDDLQLEAGRFIPIAFMAWDGARGETGARCSVSTWYYLLLERPRSSRPYVFGMFALLVVAAAEAGLARRVRRERADPESEI